MTAVAFFIFNRPDLTARVFAAIQQAQPTHLFIFADGPRPGVPTDEARCAAARRVTEEIDWPCKVERQYARVNLGCKARLETGLDALFDHVEEAIILEDDCLPHPSFFDYCSALLAKYRDTPQVMTIDGSNFYFGQYHPTTSYTFSRYPLLWGWATWRRAWQHKDPAMRDWPQLGPALIQDLLDTPAAQRYWTFILKRNHATQASWDYAWIYSCWQQGGLAITPAINLVSNIGFGADATNTVATTSTVANIPTKPLAFPLIHPPTIAIDHQADTITDSLRFSGPEFLEPLFRATRAHLRT